MELEVEQGFDVLSRRRAGLPGLPAPGERPGGTAEEGVENVAQPAAAGEPGERVARPLTGRAEHVVLPPALRVLQGLVGAVDELEAFLVVAGGCAAPAWRSGWSSRASLR